MRVWVLRHFARPGTAQTFLPEVDGLRCVAIVAVVFYHLQGFVASALGALPHAPLGTLHELFALGWFGVPLFFCLSGFIIARPFFEGRKPRLGAYFLRRLSRLEPPYFINLLIIFTLKVTVLGVALAELSPHLLASLVYLHGPIFGTHSEVNGVAWSLEVEWQFYVLAPVLAGFAVLLGAKRGPWLLLGLAVLAGWPFLAADDWSARLALSILKYIGFFLAGMAVAWALATNGLKHLSPESADWLGLIAIIAIWIMLDLGGTLSALLPVSTAVVLIAGLRGKYTSRLLRWWPVHCTGGMCYSIYLYHFFVISALARLLPDAWWLRDYPDTSLTLTALLLVPLSLVLCTVPYKLVERPFMIWRPGQNSLRQSFLEAFFASGESSASPVRVSAVRRSEA